MRDLFTPFAWASLDDESLEKYSDFVLEFLIGVGFAENDITSNLNGLPGVKLSRVAAVLGDENIVPDEKGKRPTWIDFYQLKQLALSNVDANTNWNGVAPALPGVEEDYIDISQIEQIYTKVYHANQTLIGLENVENHLSMLQKRFNFTNTVPINNLYDWIVSISPLIVDDDFDSVSERFMQLMSPLAWPNKPCESEMPPDKDVVRFNFRSESLFNH